MSGIPGKGVLLLAVLGIGTSVFLFQQLADYLDSRSSETPSPLNPASFGSRRNPSGTIGLSLAPIDALGGHLVAPADVMI